MWHKKIRPEDRIVGDDFSFYVATFLTDYPQWMKNGNCIDSQFSDITPKTCQGCPVINECFKWARDHEVEEGIYGGVDFADYDF